MDFSKLTITNFRSVDETITINFHHDQNVACLIGSNGSGKTNVLAALAIVLDVYPFRRYEVSEEDFHNKNTSKELLIELHLREPIADRDVYQKEYHVSGFRFRAWRKLKGEKGVLTQEHYCFGTDSNIIVKPTRIYKKSKETEGYDNTQRPIPVSDQAWKLGEAFYIDGPSLERFFDRTTGWNPLGRLFDIYRDDFDAEHNKYKVNDAETITARRALELFTPVLSNILKTTTLKKIEEKLSGRVSTYLGVPSDGALKIGFSIPDHRELFDKLASLQVAFQDQHQTMSVERLGSGHRVLLRLAVIETLLELLGKEQRFVLLLEEPEIYLHIHLQRHFSKLLRKIASGGHAIIFTTHSPAFVTLDSPDEIIRLNRPSSFATQPHQIPSSASFNFSKAGGKIRRTGSEEVLFCHHAFLTEGRDDKAIVEAVFEVSNIDVDVNSISIVDCDGKPNLPDYIKLCTYLGIDFYVLHDEDDPALHKAKNTEIEAAVKASKQAQPSLHLYKPRLETVLGEAEKCGLQALLKKVSGKTYQEIKTSFPDLVKPIDEFITTRLLLKKQNSSTSSIPVKK